MSCFLLIPKRTLMALIVLPCETTKILPTSGRASKKLFTLLLTSSRLSPLGGLVLHPRRADKNKSSPTFSLISVLFKPAQSP